jgi:pimeloyl-ACP methyl ester carboxylesterase
MKARIDGVEIEYDERGEGAPLLLLHAFPLGLFMWEAQVEALSATHRVVRFDARGFGGSSAGAGPLTMERIADDGAFLLDHLGIERAVVGGCSMGGYAAFAFVRRHPQRLAGLILQDTRAGADSAEAKANRAALAAKVLAEGASAAVEAFLPAARRTTTAMPCPSRACASDPGTLGQGRQRPGSPRRDSRETCPRSRYPRWRSSVRRRSRPRRRLDMAAAIPAAADVIPAAGHRQPREPRP